MTNPEKEPTPNVFSRRRVMNFIDKSAIHKDGATLTGISELSDSKIVTTRIEDIGASIGLEDRTLLPLLYSMYVYNKDLTREDEELASITVTDNIDGYLSIEEKGRSSIRVELVSESELGEMVSAFIERNGLSEIIIRSEKPNDQPPAHQTHRTR